MTARLAHRAAQRGFTLIEVLVAFAIAVLLLTALSRAFSGGIRAGVETDEHSEAMAIAELTIDALSAALPPRDNDEIDRREGRFAVQASVHRYGVPPAEVADPPQVLYELRATVSWQQRMHRQQVELQTLRVAPSR